MPIERENVRFHAGDSEVAVWFASVDDVFALTDPLKVLSQDELRVGHSLRQIFDRNRFFAGRALLRFALSEMTHNRTHRSCWRFRNSALGKPVLEEGLPPFEFNISHGGSCITVGVSNDHPVGVDVESIAAEECGEIVSDALTVGELERLDRVGFAEQKAAFVRIWTVKEACAKAVGLGCATDFRAMEVYFDPSPSSKAICIAAERKFYVETRNINFANRPYFSAVTLAQDTVR